MTLNSDARSDVESMRWVLTRRAALALVIVALSVLGTLRYTAYMTQTQEEERKKVLQANGGEGKDGNPGSSPSGAAGGSPGHDAAKGMAEAELVESGGRGYVSLG